MDKSKEAQNHLHDILERMRRHKARQNEDQMVPAKEHEQNAEDPTLASLRAMMGEKSDLDVQAMIRDVRDMRQVSVDSAAPVFPPAQEHQTGASPEPVSSEDSVQAPEKSLDGADDIDKLQDMIDSIFSDADAAPPSVEEPAPVAPSAPKKTRWSGGAVPEAEEGNDAVSAGIADADALSAFSELILPKAATFNVEELALDHTTHEAPLGVGTLPPEIDTLWKESFPKITDDARSVVIGKDEEKKGGILGKVNVFNKLVPKVEEYDPRLHGPLVDLSFTPAPGVEEVELYPVNEPYAYIRIVFDNTSHEYTYEVLEPVLSDAEIELMHEIKARLFEQLDVNTKDILQRGGEKDPPHLL